VEKPLELLIILWQPLSDKNLASIINVLEELHMVFFEENLDSEVNLCANTDY
jgi:hypothetical protein